jgi:hypothetical protein
MKPPQYRGERYQSDSSQYQSWIEKLCQTLCAAKDTSPETPSTGLTSLKPGTRRRRNEFQKTCRVALDLVKQHAGLPVGNSSVAGNAGSDCRGMTPQASLTEICLFLVSIEVLSLVVCLPF